MTTQLRTMRVSIKREAGAPLRTAVFEDREHIVVPVVMIKEGVLHAVNAAAPEFVPAETLAIAPAGWNGRPVMGGHPVVKGEHVSANDPRILEDHSFGRLFNTEMSGTNLRSEAWLDPSHAKPGSIGERAITRVQAGEEIEVSVGAFIVLDDKPGVFQGKKFSASWKEIVPDHLAFLAEGDTGACSNEMGCGAPRAAQLHEGVEMADKKEDEAPKRSLRERLLSLVTFRGSASAADMSDDDLRRALDASLRADEPGYLGIDSVFPGESNVVYATAPGEELELFRRSYTLADDGSVSLESKKERVEPVTRFEPLTAAEESPSPEPHKCGCEGRAAEQGATMKTKAERIEALINDNKRGFTSAHKLFLESQTDEQLATLEAVSPNPTPNPPPTSPTPSPAPSPSGPTQVPSPEQVPGPQRSAQAVSVEEYIAQAPAEVREVLGEGLRAAKAKREVLITALKGSGRCDYTDTELAAMSGQELERLAKLAAVPTNVTSVTGVDFSGRTIVRPTAASENTADEPPSLLAAIKAFQANGQTAN